MKVLPQYTRSPTGAPSSLPSSTPTKAPVAPGKQFLGCYVDVGNDRDMSSHEGQTSTTTECENICSSEGFRYMGRQYHDHCFCSNSYGKHGIADKCGDGCEQEGGFYGTYRNCIWDLQA